MGLRKIFFKMFIIFLAMGMGDWIYAQELSLKDYSVVVVKDLEVPSGSPTPESAGALMAEKAVYQIKRYDEKFKLFEMILKEGKQTAEVHSGKKVLIIQGVIKEYVRPTVGRRIGRSFIPGVGGHLGSATFAAHYQFIDKDTGKVIYEIDLRTSSIGAEDTVEYAMDRNGEALAKTILKLKGK